MAFSLKILSATFFFCFFGFFSAFAEKPYEEWNTGNITLKMEYQHFTLKNAEKYVINTSTEENISNNKIDFCLDEESDTDITKSNATKKDIDIELIKGYLEKNIAPNINQDISNVLIYKDENGNIAFDGYAMKGRTLDIEESAKMIVYAIKNNVSYVSLLVDIEEPEVVVDDQELKDSGIIELVQVGRSNFEGSSKNRIHNVMTGASKFNGYVIPKGSTFSFTDQLGAINASTGYVKELVILGDKVLPDYGGGLCQVSSTAYRGAMLAGVEIVERHNHSYSVDYYAPYGSDATIYVGHKDFKFKNTTDGDLLMQTRRGGINNEELFFIYYGTKPKRDVKIYGPLIQNYRSPPATKVTYDSNMAPGTSKTVSHRVTGFDSYFYRSVEEDGENLYYDRFHSPYQARGTWIIKGAE